MSEKKKDTRLTPLERTHLQGKVLERMKTDQEFAEKVKAMAKAKKNK